MHDRTDEARLTPAVAARWVARWERQQEHYATARAERFAVLCDAVEVVTAGQQRPLVLDLGCGPGSLTRLLDQRLPHAEIVGVDADPFLLGLGQAVDGVAVRYVKAVLGDDGWLAALRLDRPVDAVVSSTALHYLDPSSLAGLYAQVAGVLRPGGLLANGDQLPPADPALAGLADEVGRRRAAGTDPTEPGEDWQSWWAAAGADPALRNLLALRQEQVLPVGDHPVPAERHLALLSGAGFAACGVVWQVGTSTVIATLR